MKKKDSPSPPVAEKARHKEFSSEKKRKLLFLFLAGGLLVIYLLASKGATAVDAEFANQRVVHLLQEPRHRTVHQEGDLFLLDVQINAGDESFAHVHDQAILLTDINRADGPRDGAIRSITDFVSAPVTHKVANEGPGLFHIIALVNASAGNRNLTVDRPKGLAGEPQLENAWFRSYRVDLAPGEETAVQVHALPSVVIQVTAGIVQVTRDDMVIAELDHPAAWAWRKAGRSYRVRNAGQVSTAVVINEGRF
jgi:hypothetical protein